MGSLKIRIITDFKFDIDNKSNSYLVHLVDLRSQGPKSCFVFLPFFLSSNMFFSPQKALQVFMFPHFSSAKRIRNDCTPRFFAIVHSFYFAAKILHILSPHWHCFHILLSRICFLIDPFNSIISNGAVCEFDQCMPPQIGVYSSEKSFQWKIWNCCFQILTQAP